MFISGAVRQVSWASEIGWRWREVGTAGQRQALMRRLQQQPPAIAMNTPYLRHHHIVALLQSGLREEAVAEIKAYWGAMVAYGADTFWEIFDPQHPDFSPYGSKLINSYCHAWSCTRLCLFASTDFNNNDKRVIYGRNNVYPVAAALWLWHCQSLLQPCVADDLLYLMFFYTDVMGLPAYHVGLMFLVTRLVDGVADVLMGLVIGNTTTRWGRCRPLLADRRPAFWPAVYSGLLCAGFRHHRQTAVRLCHLSVSVVPLHPGEYSVLRHAAVFNQ